jgi:hypothetical protein
VTIDIDTEPGFDLDNLLEESIDIQKKQREMKSSQKAGKKGAVLPKTAAWMTGPEVAQHYADVEKIKARAEGWKDIAAVLLIHSQICTTCHSEHQRVEGVFIKKEHLRLRALNYIAPKALLDWANLPREVEVRPQYSHICPACYQSQGWDAATFNITE